MRSSTSLKVGSMNDESFDHSRRMTADAIRRRAPPIRLLRFAYILPPWPEEKPRARSREDVPRSCNYADAHSPPGAGKSGVSSLSLLRAFALYCEPAALEMGRAEVSVDKRAAIMPPAVRKF